MEPATYRFVAQWLNQLRHRVGPSSPSSNKVVFSSPKHPDRLWGQPISLIQWVPAYAPGGKAAGA